MQKSTFILMILVVVLAVSTVDCEKSEPKHNEPPPPNKVPDTPDPFEIQENAEFMPSTLGHESTAQKYNESGEKFPFPYRSILKNTIIWDKKQNSLLQIAKDCLCA